tara:strand:+ start:3479 stop:5410 length:1932 start_codon:yes stop_codon:yes gene_type:complete
MGAYDNPTILRNESLGVLTKYIEGIGKSTASLLLERQKRREARVASTQKNKTRVRSAQSKISNIQWKNATDNQGKYTGEKSGELWEAYQRNVKWLLEGDDKGYMGSIWAATQLEINTNLTKEQEAEYREIVNAANIYQTNAIQNNSYAIGDLIDLDGISPSGMLGTHYWGGSNDIEKDTSMMTAYGLKHLALDGVTYFQDQLVGDGKSIENGGNGFARGASILYVKSTIEVGSEGWDKLSDDTKEELNKNLQTGEGDKKYGTLEFKKDFASLINDNGEVITGGLIRKMGETLNIEKLNTETKIKDDDGGLNPNYILGGGKVFVTSPIGESGRSATTSYTILDERLIEANKTFEAELDGAVAEMLNVNLRDPNTEGDLLAQMQNTLQMGVKDWGLQLNSVTGKPYEGKEGETMIEINNFDDFSNLEDQHIKEEILKAELREYYMENTFSGEGISKGRFKDLPYNFQQYITDQEGQAPDPDKFYYAQEGETTKTTDASEDFYMQEIADDIMGIQISQHKDEWDWNKQNVEKHINFIRTKLRLGAVTGDEARVKVREMWERKNREAVDRKETEVNVDAKVSAVNDKAIWIKNPANQNWEEVPKNVYDPFDNSSLRNIAKEYMQWGQKRKEKFENYNTRLDNPLLGK